MSTLVHLNSSATSGTIGALGVVHNDSQASIAGEVTLARLEDAVERLRAQNQQCFEKLNLQLQTLMARQEQVAVGSAKQSSTHFSPSSYAGHPLLLGSDNNANLASALSSLSGPTWGQPNNFLEVPHPVDGGKPRSSEVRWRSSVTASANSGTGTDGGGSAWTRPRRQSNILGNLGEKVRELTGMKLRPSHAVGSSSFASSESDHNKKPQPRKIETKDFQSEEEERRKRALKVGQLRAQSKISNGLSGPDVAPFRSKVQTLLRRVVQSPPFDHGSALVVIANSIFIGMQVQNAFHTSSPPTWHTVMEFVFLTYFFVELGMRISAEGWVRFFSGKESGWNTFDFVVILASALPRLISSAKIGGITLVRVLRIIRVLRVLRIVRISRFFKQLRLLVYAIASTLKTCFWTTLLICLIMYIFSICIAQFVAYYIQEEEDDGRDVGGPLLVYWGSLGRSFGTLYMSVTGGIDWEVAAQPLVTVGWEVIGLFVLYITLLVICVLNLTTGIFVESALEAAQSDRENTITAQLAESEKYVAELTRLFMEWDESEDKLLTLAEFEERLAHGHCVALFRSLDIDPSDAWTFFKLLDQDGSGVVDLDEFINGCIRLKGRATGFHMERIAYENRWIMSAVTDVGKRIGAIMLQLGCEDGGPMCHLATAGNGRRSSRTSKLGKHSSTEEEGRPGTALSKMSDLSAESCEAAQPTNGIAAAVVEEAAKVSTVTVAASVQKPRQEPVKPMGEPPTIALPSELVLEDEV